MLDSFRTRSTLRLADAAYDVFRLDALPSGFEVARLPYSLRILLEGLLRAEDGRTVTAEQIEAFATWSPAGQAHQEIAFLPSRVLLQDFTGVPVLADLVAMREACERLGGGSRRLEPVVPTQLVVDHSLRVDVFAQPSASSQNARLELERNAERYSFLRWAGGAFGSLEVLPPGSGIVHQVNLERLSRVVETRARNGRLEAFPDTLVGADSHTTMANGLGVLGWGVGGIDAEAAMLGEPLSLPLPAVVGVRLAGELSPGATATDLVLTITETLRRVGVVGKFVEYSGPALDSLPLPHRATIANMAPEYGATCGFFPVDAETVRYLLATGRSREHVALVEAYCKELGFFRGSRSEPMYSETVEIDLSEVEPSMAGPRRPYERLPLASVRGSFEHALREHLAGRQPSGKYGSAATHGAVAIAAITSCTNTSNPDLMIAAGLLAKRAVAKGLRRKPWVKTSLAPGSRAVTSYLDRAGLSPYLDELGFGLVGYGCTTCIGNSGPLPEEVSRAIADEDLLVCSVLSGNRNFEGRIHPEVKLNYLASPPLVVAYALAGRIDIDLTSEPLGLDGTGDPVYLRDLWPSETDVHALVESSIDPDTYVAAYAANGRWGDYAAPRSERFDWDPASTYLRRPPFLDGIERHREPLAEIEDARCLLFLGDAVTTDHISPAGAIDPESPAGRYLLERGVAPADFDSYGSRRGNHDVMARGTFASARLRNLLAPGTEGGVTLHLPDGAVLPVYEAAARYGAEGVPLVVLAGKDYGSGSSRDWAAKGPRLLGVRAVLADSFERIHRANLAGMGIVPLQFETGQSAVSLGLSGRERFTISGLENGEADEVVVTAVADGGRATSFIARVRLDTQSEREYVRHGGLLPFLVRKLCVGAPATRRDEGHDRVLGGVA